MLYQLRVTQKVEPIQLQPPHFLGPIVIFCMIMLICLRIYFNRAVSYIICSNRAVLYGITSYGAYNMDTWHVQNYTLFGIVSVLLPHSATLVLYTKKWLLYVNFASTFRIQTRPFATVQLHPTINVFPDKIRELKGQLYYSSLISYYIAVGALRQQLVAR